MTFPTRPRSWLTRGYFNPAPWGDTISSLAAETEVAFARTTRVKNSMGGFTGGDETAPYMSAMCHVEIEETTPYRTAGAGASVGPIQSRHYVILVPWRAFVTDQHPEGDPALIPQPRDRVQFTDALGKVIDMPINGVPDAPVNAQDHIELQTDEFF